MLELARERSSAHIGRTGGGFRRAMMRGGQFQAGGVNAHAGILLLADHRRKLPVRRQAGRRT